MFKKPEIRLESSLWSEPSQLEPLSITNLLDDHPYICILLGLCFVMLVKLAWETEGRQGTLILQLEDGEIDSEQFRRLWKEEMDKTYKLNCFTTLFEKLGVVESMDQIVEKAERMRERRARIRHDHVAGTGER